jgi:hypothetical protein
MEVGGQSHAPTSLPPGKRSGTHFAWVPEPVWIDAENVAPTRIRYKYRLASSDLLQQLRYSGSQFRKAVWSFDSVE